jgi:putative copper resistance protein D
VSLHAFATEWGTDGPIGLAFTLLAVASGIVYLLAAEIGRRRDRRGRRWPLRRTACFLGGLVVLIVDLDSGIGGLADDHLAAHMIEHMVMWLIVAPLLAAGGPVRLALFACGRDGRRRLARWLHSPVVTVLTSPVGSVGLFAIVLLGTHVPAVYDLTLTSEWVHVSEHALYLFCSILIWAPLLGVDPLPGRADARGQALCMAACMVWMAIIGVWLLAAGTPIYAHYQDALGTAGALHDQRAAGLIMLVAGVPAFGVVPLARLARLIPAAGTARPWLPEADQIVA